MSEDPAMTPEPRSNLSPHIVWGGVTVVIVIVTGVVVLAAMGKETSALLQVVQLAALPILALFGAVLSNKTNQITAKVEQVREATNGNLSKLLALLAQTHPNIARPDVALDQTRILPPPHEDLARAVEDATRLLEPPHAGHP